MLVALAESPAFWRLRLKSCSLMAPVARLCHTSFPRRMFAALRIPDAVALLLRGEVLKRRQGLSPIYAFLCEFIPEVFQFTTDRKLNNLGQLAVFAGHVPSGASVRCYQHFA